MRKLYGNKAYLRHSMKCVAVKDANSFFVSNIMDNAIDIEPITGGKSKVVTSNKCNAPEIDYEKLLFDHDIQREDLETALAMVRDFVAKKGRILVGGQALDYALRAKGGCIYGDNVIPDYDFLSPDHYADAIELGNALCDAGLPSVSIIFAMHITTMKVRVESVGVADISYAPPSVIKELKTIKYKDLNIIHPISQMIDQHRALCYGYEYPSFGGTAQRWAKDMTRYNMVSEYYSIDDIDKPSIKLHAATVKIPISLLKDWNWDASICGYAAHAIVESDYKLEGNNLIINLRNNIMQILSDDCDGVVKSIIKHYKVPEKNVKHYNSYMGQIPRSTHIMGDITWIIYDNLGSLVAAKPIDKLNISVVSAHFTLMYYLHIGDYDSYKALMENKDAIKPFAEYYGSLNRADNLQHSMDIFEDNSRRNDLPKNLYPEDGVCDVMGEFLYESDFFQIDGKAVKK